MVSTKSRFIAIKPILRRLYPAPKTALLHKNPFQLLIATILSAQCTDERVNKVTPGLFKKYPTPAAFAAAKYPEVEKIIHSTGFYHNKARSIVDASAQIMKNFGGQVPPDMDKLLSLRGVARKTANVVLGSGFGIAAGIVVDTHVKRLALRMGLSNATAPEKVELDLIKIADRKDWIWLSHALIMHGRAVCKALKPDCDTCAANKICAKKGLPRKTVAGRISTK